MRVAVHNDDIDGIASAALILIKYPNADIDFLSVTEAMETEESYDIVADLPKSKNAKVNIDHHESNLERLKREGRLNPTDLIDPSSPSAARLVARYLGLENNPIAKEIVEMADYADTGHLDDELYKLDKVIKYYLRDKKILREVATILSKKGKNFSEDQVFQALWNNVKTKIDKSKEKIDKGLEELREKKAKLAVVLIGDDVPYFLVKDIAHKFIDIGGYAIAVFYRDPNTGKPRVSIRVSNRFNFYANKLAEELGGGGHEKAAGAILDNKELSVFKTLERFGEHGPVIIIKI